MTQEEKFKIWDVTNPEVHEVRMYLARMCGQTPLPLVYVEDGSRKTTKEVLPEKKANLIGFLLDETTVMYLKALTYEDITQLTEVISACVLREPGVNVWVKELFANFPNPRVATKQDIRLLNKKLANVLTTLEVLNYHGVEIPKPSWEYLGWLNKGSDCIEHWDGLTKISFYAEKYGNILVFADYSLDPSSV